MRFKIGILTIFILLAFIPILSQAEYELPINTKRLSEKVLFVWSCDHMQTIATVALAAEKGIVVIDTSLGRTNDARIRSTIEKEFGRKDFKYLINTHYHHDHTAGNQIYSDTTIVGHKNVMAGMKEELTGEGFAQLVARIKNLVKDWEEALNKENPESDDYKFLFEGVAYGKMALKDFDSGFIPTFPSILFEKRLNIDMGDMTFELYSFGGMHTDSDIVIFIPEEGLLVVGDITPEGMLPYMRKDLKTDFSVTLENWGKIAEKDIKHTHMIHSDMHLSTEAFKENYKYFHTLWNRLTEMHRKGMKIEDAKKEFTIEDDFPYYKDKRVQTSRGSIHENNIEAIWERITSQ
jgi:glyoxylase-like metal-dependent hydrolase (beta-lactamase superfamily II)